MSCTFKVNLVVFADVFEEYYIFAIIMDPFQTSFLAPLTTISKQISIGSSKSMKFTYQTENQQINTLTNRIQRAFGEYFLQILQNTWTLK